MFGSSPTSMRRTDGICPRPSRPTRFCNRSPPPPPESSRPQHRTSRHSALTRLSWTRRFVNGPLALSTRCTFSIRSSRHRSFCGRIRGNEVPEHAEFLLCVRPLSSASVASLSSSSDAVRRIAALKGRAKRAPAPMADPARRSVEPKAERRQQRRQQRLRPPARDGRSASSSWLAPLAALRATSRARRRAALDVAQAHHRRLLGGQGTGSRRRASPPRLRLGEHGHVPTMDSPALFLSGKSKLGHYPMRSSTVPRNVVSGYSL